MYSRAVKYSTSLFRQQRRGFIRIVQQGYEGMRLTLGRNPVKLEPGLRMSIPLLHKVRKVDMRERSLRIDNLAAFTSDNVPVTIEGSLFFQVNNSHDALFNVSEYEKNVYRIGTSAMRSIVGTLEYDDIIADRNKINKTLQTVIGDTIKSWGIDCSRFEVQGFEPSNRDIRKQLEQQMEAERARRKQLLDTEAAVNVAEGMKRKTILESEGALQAQKNLAEGEYISVVRRAEAQRMSLVLEAEGIADQVSKISECLKDPLTTSSFLLELKRIEQLKSVADGNNNTVYFAQDRNVVHPNYMVDWIEKTKS